MKFANNPFEILTEIIKEHYPSVECDIYIGQELTDGEETFGCTVFPEDETRKPSIEIHYSLSLHDATEVLAHELAHVITGYGADHNKEWEKVFDDIHIKFQKKLDERFR